MSVIYSNIAKPIFDMVLFSLKLAEGERGVGKLGIFMTFFWYAFSSVVISFVSPSFGEMAAVG